ncbi:MAG: gas vesicle protein GvpN, partial [Nanoarchaeota archaeon]
MVYIATHKREIIGRQIHETLEEKRKSEKVTEKELKQFDSSLSQIKKILEIEKVESEYLTPEVKNWVETDAVKAVKARVKNWLSLKYPVHIIGPTGCGKTILALQVAKE